MLYEDLPVDTGEVKFLYRDCYYKIFIGNGSENAYELCFLIDGLVDKVNQPEIQKVWEEILLYEDQILSTIYSDSTTEIRDSFECPDANYFERVFANYESFRNPLLSSYFEQFVSLNEELYEFFTARNKLPLFLPMMKECFLEKL